MITVMTHTGFADSVEDREIISERVREHFTKEPYEKRKVPNTVRAFAIHAALVVSFFGVAAALVFVPSSFIFALVFPGMPLLYMFLAYRFLTPLPKNNLLSVSFLAVLLLLFYAVYAVVYFTDGTYSESIFILNSPFLSIATFAYLAFFGSDPAPSASFWLALIAAPFPSLSMYAGLRLKMWTQEKRRSRIPHYECASLEQAE